MLFITDRCCYFILFSFFANHTRLYIFISAKAVLNLCFFASGTAEKIAWFDQSGRWIQRGGNMDCAMVAAAPVLPMRYAVSASRIADRRMILAGHRMADLLTRVVGVK